MYGRGVAVSKSDFATYTYALLALQQSGLPLAGAVELHFTFDEEAGGLIGPGYLIEQSITKPDFVISAGFAYGIVTAHNGCLHLEVEIAGRSAHAAIPNRVPMPWRPRPAFWRSSTACAASWRRPRPRSAGIGSPQLTVGLISGGINTNVVPDRVVFRLDRRIIPEEDPDRRGARLAAAHRGGGGGACRDTLHGAAHPAHAAVHANARAGSIGGGDPDACRQDHGDERRAARRADLHRRAALLLRRHPDRALRRRPAHAAGGQRPPGRRAAGAGGSASRDGGCRARACRPAGAASARRQRWRLRWAN